MKASVTEVVSEKKNEDSIFEPGSTKVKQSFLDILNGESSRVSSYLGNSGNWPAIMKAAKEAPEAIAKMEKGLGIKSPAGKIGAMEAVSRGTASSNLGEELPEWRPPVKRQTHHLNGMEKIRFELKQMEQLAVSAARYAHDSDISEALRKVFLKARELVEQIDKGEFR